jgi:hypothetical protein
MTVTETDTEACYVYGIVPAGTTLPVGLSGLDGPVSLIPHRDVAAVIGVLFRNRLLGNRSDLLAHETVVDSIAANGTVLPMRFAAVVDSAQGLVDELLEPYHDGLVSALAALEGRTQFTLQGEYNHDVLLREILTQDVEIRRLREEIRRLGDDASYPQRLRQGELVVRALAQRREVDAERVRSALAPRVVEVSEHELASPEVVVDTAYLVEQSRQAEFEQAVEDIGQDFVGRIRLRLLGPLPVYDFVPGM